MTFISGGAAYRSKFRLCLHLAACLHFWLGEGGCAVHDYGELIRRLSIIFSRQWGTPRMAAIPSTYLVLNGGENS